MENVDFAYQPGQPVLRDISFTVARGEAAALLGANGSGKSTLLKILGGLQWPTAGRVLAFGESLTEERFTDPVFAASFRRRVGFVFQNTDAQLFCPTVADEVAYGPAQLGWTAEQVRRRVDEVLAFFGVTGLASRPPYRLSGGEKKKVALAATLAVNPEVLLLDEPTANLDPRTQYWLVSFLQRLHKAGKTLVIATHDLDIVPALAGRVLVLSEDHRLLAAGSPLGVLEDRDLLLEANLVHEHYHVHGHRGEHGHLHFHQHDHQVAHGREK
ncbi:MAG: ATP-binding cassette domain-containing protein [Thermoanaerobacterales bacterium]|nr:ATP-binding cassette domain-containing protein [Thermoanaerobacterales bacterium]